MHAQLQLEDEAPGEGGKEKLGAALNTSSWEPQGEFEPEIRDMGLKLDQVYPLSDATGVHRSARRLEDSH